MSVPALCFITQNTLVFFHQAPENAGISFGFSGKRWVSAEARSKAGAQGHIMNFCGVRKTLSTSQEPLSVHTGHRTHGFSAGLLKHLTQRLLHTTLRPHLKSSGPDLINPGNVMKSSFHGHPPPDSLAAGIPKIHISACYGQGFSDVDTWLWNRIKPI